MGGGDEEDVRWQVLDHGLEVRCDCQVSVAYVAHGGTGGRQLAQELAEGKGPAESWQNQQTWQKWQKSKNGKNGRKRRNM